MVKWTKLQCSVAKVAKKKVTLKGLNVSGAKGAVTYTKASGSKKLSINKKTAVGNYKIEARSTTAGNTNYSSKFIRKTANITVELVAAKIASIKPFSSSGKVGFDIAWTKSVGAKKVEIWCYRAEVGLMDVSAGVSSASKGRARVYLSCERGQSVKVYLYTRGRKDMSAQSSSMRLVKL